MSEISKGPTVLVGGLFAIVGAALVAAAIARGLATMRFIRNAAAADGFVVCLLAGGSHPDVEFSTPSGQQVTYAQGGLIFGYQVGDRVRVLYDPADPAKTACLDRLGALWFTPILLSTLGIIFLANGLWKALAITHS